MGSSYGTIRAVTVLCHDRTVSKHSDWLSDDFKRCDWLNRMSSIPYRDRNSMHRFPTHTKMALMFLPDYIPS